MWEFWQASKQSDGWHASWGGAIKHVSQSRGYYTTNSWPGLSAAELGRHGHEPAGDRGNDDGQASCAPPGSGTPWRWISPHRGPGEYSWPAQRTDGHGPPGAIPEGARLRLPPDLNLQAMNLPRLTLKIARAVKRRGMIVRDQTGVAIGFYAQDPVGLKSDPYNGPNGMFAGQKPSQILARFPWEQAQGAQDEPLLRPVASLPAALAG